MVSRYSSTGGWKRSCTCRSYGTGRSTGRWVTGPPVADRSPAGTVAAWTSRRRPSTDTAISHPATAPRRSTEREPGRPGADTGAGERVDGATENVGEDRGDGGRRLADPLRFHRWMRTSSAGGVLTGIALGLQHALEEHREQPAFVMEAPGEPEDPDAPITLHFDPDDPTRTVAVVRRTRPAVRPLGPRGPPADGSDDGPTGPRLTPRPGHRDSRRTRSASADDVDPRRDRATAGSGAEHPLVEHHQGLAAATGHMEVVVEGGHHGDGEDATSWPPRAARASAAPPDARPLVGAEHDAQRGPAVDHPLAARPPDRLARVSVLATHHARSGMCFEIGLNAPRSRSDPRNRRRAGCAARLLLVGRGQDPPGAPSMRSPIEPGAWSRLDGSRNGLRMATPPTCVAAVRRAGRGRRPSRGPAARPGAGRRAPGSARPPRRRRARRAGSSTGSPGGPTRGLSPTPPMSIRRQRTPAAAQRRLSSTHWRPGPTWCRLPALRKRAAVNRGTGPPSVRDPWRGAAPRRRRRARGSAQMPKRPPAPNTTGRSTTEPPPGAARTADDRMTGAMAVGVGGGGGVERTDSTTHSTSWGVTLARISSTPNRSVGAPCPGGARHRRGPAPDGPPRRCRGRRTR